MEIKKGFTLVELLVVVLIIGILAAIAVPQYQKAVEKSRASEAFILLKSLKEAQDVYKLSNPGAATPTLEQLDITIPGEPTAPVAASGSFRQTDFFQIGILSNGNPHALRVQGNKLLYILAYYDSNYTSMFHAKPGYFCNVELNEDPNYAYVCKGLGGTPSNLCLGEDTGKCFRLP